MLAPEGEERLNKESNFQRRAEVPHASARNHDEETLLLHAGD
jgi:hypothetical protein